MKPFLLPQLHELQVLRGNPIIVYNSTIDHDSIQMLYECLRQIGPTQHLDLVLSTTGGTLTPTRRLALLLREFTHHLTILVPYQARSAGTLLCLSANELILGPMSELGPIDALISTAGPPPPGTPAMISAEDIRAFRQMAEEWFGVTREKDRLQVLALLAQSIFPPSLSSFYRSDQLARQTAYELLTYQLPDVEEHVRQQIITQLVGGYHSHDHVITRLEARTLGLRIHNASSQEEALLWDLSKRMKELFRESSAQNEEDVFGMIRSAHFCARRVRPWATVPGRERPEGEPEEEGRKISPIVWVIDEE